MKADTLGTGPLPRPPEDLSVKASVRRQGIGILDMWRALASSRLRPRTKLLSVAPWKARAIEIRAHLKPMCRALIVSKTMLVTDSFNVRLRR